jgi:hypothetical protein
MPTKPPAKRLFSGTVGSPLARVNKPAPPATAPKLAQAGPPDVTRMRDMVLLHYCFNQQAGGTKKEHCKCEERAERVHRDVAEQYVKDGLADWLIVKNPRAKTGTSNFRRAIVMRSVVIDGERLFAKPSEWKSKRLDRDEKHEAIKVTIRDKAKNLLRKMFARGVIAQDIFQALQDDAELDSLFSDPVKFEKLERMLIEQRQHLFHKRFVNLAVYWWNTILGFHRLDVNAGTMMKDASAGVGRIVYTRKAEAAADAVRGNSTVNPAVFIPDPFGNEQDQFVDNGGRRVAAENHVAKPWDPKGGMDPHKYEGADLTDEKVPDKDIREEWLEGSQDLIDAGVTPEDFRYID